ncbi:pyroglutamyl-peptidase 1-like [Montipora capricornis]|uniref:pyroglutamyl-peptidase 1-like n=1 Tax=Montipora capricornis TaxID=246305 RepID=UPI0035F1BFBA
MAAESKPTVLVTGFGPFAYHTVNTSWLAVKELPKTNLVNSVNLEIREIPVEYEAVEKEVPALWNELKPKLCVHVGVHGFTDNVLLEKCAHNYGYNSPDESGNKCHHGCCVEGGAEFLSTSLDLEKISAEVMAAKSPCLVKLSDDAGRFLCDYIYYKSLSIRLGTCAFIHVPRVDSPYSKEELVETLKLVVLAMLQQLS